MKYIKIKEGGKEDGKIILRHYNDEEFVVF
ncbi:hypothetical protein J2Z72_001924 [Peptostreptococcus canis]|nr:hypothetical protein [Peptostreptococcus canis]